MSMNVAGGQVHPCTWSVVWFTYPSKLWGLEL